MKFWVFFSTLVFSFSQSTDYNSHIQFESIVQNKGSITEGSKCIFKFPFQNVGRTPLIISVRSSCGCLVPWWNNEPVLAGAWDTVYAQYDTKRLGNFYKTLTIVNYVGDALNFETTLYVRGEVLPKEIKGLLVYIDDDLLPTIPNRMNQIFLDAENTPQFLNFYNYSDKIIELGLDSSKFKKAKIILEPETSHRLDLSESHADQSTLDFNVVLDELTRIHFIKKNIKINRRVICLVFLSLMGQNQTF